MSNADPLSAKISPFPNLVRTFSLNMLIKYYFYPHFWSQGGVNDHKDAMYRSVSNIDGCGIFPKSLYVNSSSFANLFRIFPWNTIKLVLVPPDLVPKWGFFTGNCANTIDSYIHAVNVSNKIIFTVIINILDGLSLVFWTKIMK